MSKWTNVRKFDFAKGEYTNSYYKLNEFDYFVDTEFGSDTNDGLTPQTAFKTLAKLATLGSEYYKDGIRVACSGIDINYFSPNVMIHFVGVGGNNGFFITNLMILSEKYDIASASKYENIHFFKNGWASVTGHGYSTAYCVMNRCIIDYAEADSYRTNLGVYAYNSIFKTISHLIGAVVEVRGRNNTIGTSIVINNTSLRGLNFHALDNTNRVTADLKNSIIDTNSRYFTDNTETTPVDLYIDSANGNYGIVPTFSTPIWDKQTQQYITANPLYHTGADGANIGAGVETLALTALDDSLKSTDNGGDATYSNMENDPNSGSMIFRIDDSIDGTLVSGVQDLGRVMNGVKIDAIATYDTNGGLITKRLQQSTPSIEQTTDFGIQFGETQQECEDMTPILCEYGKVVTYSESGNIMYGNSDLNFQPNKKKVAKFRYFIISIRAKTIS